MSLENHQDSGFLDGKVAIVTGGTRGIGRAIVERLLNAGASVALCGTRQKSVDETVDALSTRGAVWGMAADVGNLDDVRRFIAAVQQRFGAVHILINNAGVGSFASVAELTPDIWQRIVGTNLTGVYYCCHEVLPIFIQGGGGDVVNIGSLAGTSAFAGGAAYNASKFGLIGFSEAMMLDHRQDGVRVSVVMPGSVNTEFGGSTDREPGRDDWKITSGDIAEIVLEVLRMPRATTVSRVEVRPSRPPRKA